MSPRRRESRPSPPRALRHPPPRTHRVSGRAAPCHCRPACARRPSPHGIQAPSAQQPRPRPPGELDTLRRLLSHPRPRDADRVHPPCRHPCPKPPPLPRRSNARRRRANAPPDCTHAQPHPDTFHHVVPPSPCLRAPPPRSALSRNALPDTAARPCGPNPLLPPPRPPSRHPLHVAAYVPPREPHTESVPRHCDPHQQHPPHTRTSTPARPPSRTMPWRPLRRV